MPCSPQRFVAPAAAAGSTTASPFDADLLGQTASDDGGTRADESSLAFTVLGSVGESVKVTVVSPSKTTSALDGTVVVIDVVIGRSGSTAVKCDATMPAPTCVCVPEV